MISSALECQCLGGEAQELCVGEECGKCYREWNKEKAVSKLDGSVRFLEGDA